MSDRLKDELYELIKKDERVFSFIQEGSLDGIWYWDLKNPENEWYNVRFSRVLGYNPSELQDNYKAWKNIVYQEDIAVAKKKIQDYIQNPQHYLEFELRYINYSGSTVWIRFKAMAIISDNGNVDRIIGMAQDITNYKKLELEANLFMERFSSFMKYTDEGFYLFETHEPVDIKRPVNEQIEQLYAGVIVECNDAMARMYGYQKAEEILGKTMAEMHGGSDVPENIAFLTDWISNNYEIRDAISEEHDVTGKSVWFSNNILGIIVDDKLIRIWGTQKEITDNVLVSKALEKSEARLKEAQTIAMLGNYEFNFYKEECWWSEETYKILGFNYKEVLPCYESFTRYISKDDLENLNQLIANAKDKGEDFTLTYSYMFPKQKPKYFELKAKV
ncbi:MAG: PAS domain-containing protein, partial [Bacteroidales bacterium]|nr:PAS domain-containing protein [Bacteroidales bacterium]